MPPTSSDTAGPVRRSVMVSVELVANCGHLLVAYPEASSEPVFQERHVYLVVGEVMSSSWRLAMVLMLFVPVTFFCSVV